MQNDLLRLRGALIWRVLLVLSLAGCQTFAPPYDEASRERVTAISTQILGLYQTLLGTPEPARRAEVAALAPRYDEIETAIRVHILLERARPANEPSVFQAELLLQKLMQFRGRYLGGAPDLLSSSVIAINRDALSDLLVAMLAGEEAKKLAGPAAEG